MDIGSEKSFTSFLDWSVSEVLEWLQSLSLHGNYERQFQGDNRLANGINGFLRIQHICHDLQNGIAHMWRMSFN